MVKIHATITYVLTLRSQKTMLRIAVSSTARKMTSALTVKCPGAGPLDYVKISRLNYEITS